MPLASQAALRATERAVYKAVRANPFKTVEGNVTWEVIEEFEEYARDLALEHQPSYGFCEEVGMCYLVMTPTEFAAETGVEPEFDYPEKPGLLPEGYEDMDDDTLRLAERELDEKNKDYAMHQGFSKGFGENIRDAFPEKYYQALHGGTLVKYKHVKPLSYIENLRRKVPLDTHTVKMLKKKLYRGWEEEDVEGFKKRLTRESDRLGRLHKPIIVSDADLLQHYMEEMWKRTDVFDQHCMTDFIALDDDAEDEEPLPTQDWDTVTQFFERKWKEAEDYIANGGQTNKFADASAMEDLQARHEEQIRKLKEESANAITEMERRTANKIDKLAEAILQMANKRKEERRRRPRAQQNDHESSSDEEDEPAPTPPPRKKKKAKRRAARRAPAAPPSPAALAGDRKVYVPGEPFVRGMRRKANPSREWNAVYHDARNRFMMNAGAEGIRERLDGLARYKQYADAGQIKGFDPENHKALVAKWEAALAEKEKE